MANMQTVRTHDYGGPEVLKLEKVPCPQPGAIQLACAVAAITSH
jgi:NADPH:quinone reductase-like Zn-dependent oxidoreductase